MIAFVVIIVQIMAAIQIDLLSMPIAASILFPPAKNGIKVSCPPSCSPQRNEKKKIPPSFHPAPPHLDFEVNFPSSASGHISTLKMSQMVEIFF